MPKYRVAELEGALLDAAVALAEGIPGRIVMWCDRPTFQANSGAQPHYSTEWRDGGPIIDRDHISVVWTDDPVSKEWCAQVGSDRTEVHFGATALVAAMRAYVASKLGREVDLL